MTKTIFFSIFFVLIVSCADQSKEINNLKKFKNYSNKGFALIYDESLFKKKIINKKINNRSLLIFNNYLEHETPVKITNLLNGKYLIAKVSLDANFPLFYNSVISNRIAQELELDSSEPYVEIKTLSQNNSFVIAKAKTFNEEKKVANKLPVEGITIKNISNIKVITKKTLKKPKPTVNFQYNIKIADFYFEDSAKNLQNSLLNEYSIKNVKLKKMSKNRYRIYTGPFNNLDSIKNAYSDIIKLNFENIEIIKL